MTFSRFTHAILLIWFVIDSSTILPCPEMRLLKSKIILLKPKIRLPTTKIRLPMPKTKLPSPKAKIIF
jgi:hypothetical protein